jgi:hypothetical protein
MGLLDTIKGWFNIGGVKVQLQDVPTKVSRAGASIGGKVVLTTKQDKHVNKLVYKLVRRRTSGRGDEKKTEEKVLAQNVVGGPLELKGGDRKVMDLSLPIALEKELKDVGGVLGGVGKLGAFAAGEKDEYLLIVEADVKGAAFNPSAQQRVTFTE